MKVYATPGEEACDDATATEEAQARADRREAVDAGVMLSAGTDVAAVLHALGISEATRVQRPFEKYQTRLLSLCGMLDLRPPLPCH